MKAVSGLGAEARAVAGDGLEPGDSHIFLF